MPLALAQHPYGWLSLAPPVVAVVLAIATGRVYLSLLAGLLAGALVTTGGDPVRAVAELFEVHLWHSLIDHEKLRMFAFILAIGATIGLLYRSGGMQGFVDLVAPLARTRRSGQLTVWGAGLLIFFDDYSNTLLLGGTFRPVCDRLRISRAKLAYLVDSTAAPVAGLALISTWVAVEIDYIAEGIGNLKPEVSADASALDLFLGCLPYRFYVIQALILVPIIALLGREFGPMRREEQAALDAPEPLSEAESTIDEPAPQSSHWIFAATPLAMILAVVVYFLWTTGTAGLVGADLTSPKMAGWGYVREVLGKANATLSLFYGSIAGLATAVLISLAGRKLGPRGVASAALRGARGVAAALVILWLATAMSRMTGNRSVVGESGDPFQFSDYRLYTGDYLGERLTALSALPGAAQHVARFWPTIVMITACVVAFCTGTSFGTMGILMPMVLPLSLSTLEAAGLPADLSSPLLLGAIGAVMAGAIFGDHCSPISDTTILSSQSSGCDHMLHVGTQLPYALLVAGVTIVLGTIPIGFGVNVWLLLAVQTAALVAAVRLLGGRIESQSGG
ncbi:Na+/H+ antiporter family protein [Pirellulimonas nuda]|uniref:Na+/H+ antiporter family protein n=1 Tax=Pirellulimonas nuda TaxID=2528009 RepID=A0A518D683_9BACT|nr:Na+/H+ antiporter NhaC family protein [Pirellulimonas nuda]QDU86983.1 Na+/H+ antiporter family protein [Pirellulimonas nuda]